MAAKNKNSSAKCIIVLLVIAIICVAILAVLNDLLYVPPDMSVFNKAAEGTYEEDSIKDVAVSSGKVVVVTKGVVNGKNVAGMYVTGNKFGKADSFSLAVIVELDTNKIVGVYEITDGSTGGYAYDESKLKAVVGTDITSSDYVAIDNLVQTGTTNSSNAVKNALMTAAEYYKAAYNS